jgi:hypothetical protein
MVSIALVFCLVVDCYVASPLLFHFQSHFVTNIVLFACFIFTKNNVVVFCLALSV